MPMRALPKKRLSAIAMLQQGRSSKQEVSNLLGVSQSTCSRIHREYVPHVERSRGACPRSMCKSHHSWWTR